MVCLLLMISITVDLLNLMISIIILKFPSYSIQESFKKVFFVIQLCGCRNFNKTKFPCLNLMFLFKDIQLNKSMFTPLSNSRQNQDQYAKCNTVSACNTYPHSKTDSFCNYSEVSCANTNLNSYYQNCDQVCSNAICIEPPRSESRIQYVPYEKKFIEIDQIERIVYVPYEKEIVEYQQIVYTKRVPIQRTVTDYYAIQTQVEYIPQVTEETILQYQPVEKIYHRLEYIPIQTKIVHLPDKQNCGIGQYQAINNNYKYGCYTIPQATCVPNFTGVCTNQSNNMRQI